MVFTYYKDVTAKRCNSNDCYQPDRRRTKGLLWDLSAAHKLFFLTFSPQEKAGEKSTLNTSVCKAMHTSVSFLEPNLVSFVHSDLFCHHNNAEKSIQTLFLFFTRKIVFLYTIQTSLQ